MKWELVEDPEMVDEEVEEGLLRRDHDQGRGNK